MIGTIPMKETRLMQFPKDTKNSFTTSKALKKNEGHLFNNYNKIVIYKALSRFHSSGRKFHKLYLRNGKILIILSVIKYKTNFNSDVRIIYTLKLTKQASQ